LWLAIGHLAEAEAELDARYHDLAIRTREVRLEVMEKGDSEKLMDLLDLISSTTKDDATNCCNWR
jgi:hypothetical protein